MEQGTIQAQLAHIERVLFFRRMVRATLESFTGEGHVGVDLRELPHPESEEPWDEHGVDVATEGSPHA